MSGPRRSKRKPASETKKASKRQKSSDIPLWKCSKVGCIQDVVAQAEDDKWYCEKCYESRDYAGDNEQMCQGATCYKPATHTCGANGKYFCKGCLPKGKGNKESIATYNCSVCQTKPTHVTLDVSYCKSCVPVCDGDECESSAEVRDHGFNYCKGCAPKKKEEKKTQKKEKQKSYDSHTQYACDNSNCPTPDAAYHKEAMFEVPGSQMVYCTRKCAIDACVIDADDDECDCDNDIEAGEGHGAKCNLNDAWRKKTGMDLKDDDSEEEEDDQVECATKGCKRAGTIAHDEKGYMCDVCIKKGGYMQCVAFACDSFTEPPANPKLAVYCCDHHPECEVCGEPADAVDVKTPDFLCDKHWTNRNVFNKEEKKEDFICDTPNCTTSKLLVRKLGPTRKCCSVCVHGFNEDGTRRMCHGYKCTKTSIDAWGGVPHCSEKCNSEFDGIITQIGICFKCARVGVGAECQCADAHCIHCCPDAMARAWRSFEKQKANKGKRKELASILEAAQKLLGSN